MAPRLCVERRPVLLAVQRLYHGAPNNADAVHADRGVPVYDWRAAGERRSHAPPVRGRVRHLAVPHVLGGQSPVFLQFCAGDHRLRRPWGIAGQNAGNGMKIFFTGCAGGFLLFDFLFLRACGII